MPQTPSNPSNPFPGAATALPPSPPNYCLSLSQAELSGTEEKEDFSMQQGNILVFHWYKPQRSPCFPGERCRGAGMVLQNCHRSGKGQEDPGQTIPTARMPWGYQNTSCMSFPTPMKQKRRKMCVRTEKHPPWRESSRELFWRELRGERWMFFLTTLHVHLHT